MVSHISPHLAWETHGLFLTLSPKKWVPSMYYSFDQFPNAKGHPLLSIMPCAKPSSHNLRKETCSKPKINTMHFKTSFIDHLVFKCELAM